MLHCCVCFVIHLALLVFADSALGNAYTVGILVGSNLATAVAVVGTITRRFMW